MINEKYLKYKQKYLKAQIDATTETSLPDTVVNGICEKIAWWWQSEAVPKIEQYASLDDVKKEFIENTLQKEDIRTYNINVQQIETCLNSILKSNLN